MRISDWSSDVCSSDLLPLSYGGAGLRPEGVGAWDKPYSPVMVYRWDAVRDALWNLAKVSGGTPFDGHMLRYANPLTGGWALQTMGAHMQMLPVGFRGQAHLHTGTVVYNVAGGRGLSNIGGTALDWSTHHAFRFPGWPV